MRTVCLAVIAASLCIGGAHAQDSREVLLERPAPDQGYMFGLGLGIFGAHVVDDGEALPIMAGGAGVLRLDQSVTHLMDLGISLEFGASGGPRERSGSLFVFGIDWALHPYRPMFVRLGGGIGVHQVSAPVDSENDASAFGAAFSLTLGYALYPFYEKGESGSWAFSPVVQLKTLQPFDDDAVFWGGIGIEVALWNGLPDNQLDLTLDEVYGPPSSSNSQEND